MTPIRALPVQALLALSLVACAAAEAHARNADTLPSPVPQAEDIIPTLPPPHEELMRFLLQGVENPALLKGYRVAIVAADGVDGFDLEVPKRFLLERGAAVSVIAPRPIAPHSGADALPAKITMQNPSGEDDATTVDAYVDPAAAVSYDLVYVPSHPDTPTAYDSPDSIALVQAVQRAGRPIFLSGNAILLALKAGLLPPAETSTAAVADSAGRVPALAPRTGARLYSNRDAYTMPAFMGRLVRVLLADPPVASR